MIITLILIVLTSSIAVFFLDEFMGLYKKIIAFPPLKLILPLLIASWVIEAYEHYGLQGLIILNDGFHYLAHLLATTVPFKEKIILILQLFFLASLPIWLMRGWEKSKGIPVPGFYAPCFGLVIWLIAAMMVVTPKM